MTPFLVLSPGGFINKHGIEITIKSFASLFHSVTPKHQRRLRLIIIEEEGMIPKLENQLHEEDLRNAVNVISRENVENVETAYQEASVFLFPAPQYGYKIIVEALSYGLPVLAFECSNSHSILDNTCSLLIKNKQNYNHLEDFSRMLEMLYFDPEVRKVLSKGAKCKEF